MNLSSLLKNNRFYILVGSVLLSLVIYSVIITLYRTGTPQIIRLSQIYGFLALGYLYLAILIGPFCYTFKNIPYHEKILHGRRAIGVSAFYFSLLHSLYTFFGQLGGWNGVGFLSNTYLWAVGLGATALFILFLMASTSFDIIITWMTFSRWKSLQQLVYFAGIFLIIHVLLLGTHYQSLSDPIPQITFFALAGLFLLEAPRLDRLWKRFIGVPQFGLSFLVIAVVLAVCYFTYISPLTTSTTPVSFDIHAAHRQLAAQVAQAAATPSTQSSIPGLQGDRNRRYSVSIQTNPTIPQPNQPTTLTFNVYDANTGAPLKYFRILYAKTSHLIIANNSLSYFAHEHPTENGSGFTITTQFPDNDMYHVYLNFQPVGGIEQQYAFFVSVGQLPSYLKTAHATIDSRKTKVFGDYAVSLDTHGELQADVMSLGNQTITFSLKNAKTGKPITSLQPYLSAYGHLTMIKEDTFDFIHVHPYTQLGSKAQGNGGPKVDFLPLGIYGPFKPGNYRVFAEFNPDGKLFTADFTVEIK